VYKRQEVKEALKKIAINGLTVTEVKGCGVQRGYKNGSYEETKPIVLNPKVKLEIVVDEEDVEKIIDIIQKYAKTGHIGDGKIFVTPVEDIIRIRTSEKGRTALK